MTLSPPGHATVDGACETARPLPNELPAITGPLPDELPAISKTPESYYSAGELESCYSAGSVGKMRSAVASSNNSNSSGSGS